MQITVEREITMRLVVSPERGVDVPTRLRYRSEDPYAVHVTFHTNSPVPVDWTFARELLMEGVVRATGRGDVRVRPADVDGRPVISLELTSPDGDALLQAPAEPLSAWLEHTLRAVPAGAEMERLGLEEGLTALLAEGDTGRNAERNADGNAERNGGPGGDQGIEDSLAEG
ncbi:SsgA family sporulation/cell division regulator [Streptomyces alkaliphilus]|uniref:SsgA family sporulation/cell division regulator n=1 Tax=Streptomyces alkaliphilus TaxID=1472722 RepID=A0A7W3THW3_9ACTN|nr:SsgA family sporulation/cell division regulator [Streptomyces alkaliphilus]MBB0247131.1 SsgA family sporulation/cell division regulator [Streptomyces alkaliphilus]